MTIVAALAIGAGGVACDELDQSLDSSPAPTRASTPGATPVLRDGRASVELRGDARGLHLFGTLTEPITYGGPDAPLSLVWRSESFDLFTLGGEVRLGEQPTSETLRVQLAVEVDGEVIAFASDAGECVVTVREAEPRSFAGSIDCEGLLGGDPEREVDASGTFEAASRHA